MAVAPAPAAFGALQGLVVLDLTQMLAGPFATQMLADHGADVIKVEPPEGDSTRQFGPFHADDTLGSHGGYFQSVNRNKKSIVLDLKSKKGHNDFLELARTADIVIENFREGVMDRLGLGWKELSAANPRLIYSSIRGFGDPHGHGGESPYKQWPAFDVVAQAMGGLIGITGEDAASVVKVGPGVGDIMPGLLSAFGILAAVIERNRSGYGQFVDVAMADTILALCERIVYQYAYAAEVSGPEGRQHPMFAPFGLFRARDGVVAIACVQQHQWTVLCDAMGRLDLREAQQFSSAQLRLSNRDAVVAAVSQWTARHTKKELASLLGGLVPFGPVYDAADIFADPHFHARDMLPEVSHAGVPQPVRIAGIPLKLSRTPGRILSGAPVLGQHTEEVLAAARPVSPVSTAAHESTRRRNDIEPNT